MQQLNFQNGDLWELSEQAIAIGKQLIENLNSLRSIDGVQKLQRKIAQELKFIRKAEEKGTLKVNQLMCSNLIHYEYFVELLRIQPRVICVDCIFSTKKKKNSLRVDIVCENGCKWIKVIARNSQSLNDVAKGRSGFGGKSIIDHAREYIRTASEHPCMYQPPKVVFLFRHSIDSEFTKILKDMGIEVQNTFKSVSTLKNSTNFNITVLNIDVSTMIAYVSALTNGSANWIFQEEILTCQGFAERNSPVKPILQQQFEGKQLICCKTALKSFQDIIGLLSGPNEKLRAEKFLENIKIYPDIHEIPPELRTLKLGGKIKIRSLKIFAFGFVMKAITVTSNEGFIRSAKMQGINFPTFIHQARALTEQKELLATPL